jgi:hypothetical protein
MGSGANDGISPPWQLAGMGLKLVIGEMHPASDAKLLNEEWLFLHNQGDTPFNTAGCSLAVANSPNARPRVITTLKAGLVLKPGVRVRLISGSAAKKSYGEAPAEEEGLRNFYLMLKAPYLEKPGLIVSVAQGQHHHCRATFDAKPPK